MSMTPAGGAATVGGVVYQLLWSLLELTRFQVTNVEESADGVITSAVIILEPAGGGGDARVESGDELIVTQIKSRSDGSTWSLQEVITLVLPDLLKGVRLDAPKPSYRFVTDGRIGNWESVRRFFISLRGCNGSQLEAAINSPGTLSVGARLGASTDGKMPFWTKAEYTRRELVSKITESLSARVKPQELEGLEHRVVHLLAHFEFCEPVTVAEAEARIDAALSERADYVENVPSTRRDLLQRLAELARGGNSRIRLATFLRDQGLDALPASSIGNMVTRGRTVVERRLRSLKFRREHHVQEQFTERLAERVRDTPIVLITGQSGAGKSWHCCAIADLLVRRGAIVAHADAASTAHDTLDRAMGILWNTVKGQDSQLPYDRAAKRLHGPPPERILVIDRVESPSLARDLAVADCHAVNLRLVLGCTQEAAEAAKRAAPERCESVEVSHFSWYELNDYLAARQASRWDNIPADVREILRTPFVANLYCESVRDDSWRPSNEYDLCEHYWNDRTGPEGGADPTLDRALLRELARAFLSGEPYPWSADGLHRLVKHEGSLSRLRRSGILATRADGSCEVWHDRLLNWLVASTLVEDVASSTRSPDDIAAICAQAANGVLRPSGKSLGYVPMDVLWLLAARGEHAAAASILAALEAALGHSDLYTELIPTLGVRAVPILLHRLDELIESGSSHTTTDLANCLARIESPEAVAKARTLLAGDSREGHSVALSILRRQGDPESLNRVWAIHLSATGDNAHALESRMRMEALRQGIGIRPAWLIERLESACADTPGLADLVYQLSRIGNGAQIWSRLKHHLKVTVPPEKRRALVRCIQVFRDREEIDFLRAEASRDEDFVGDMALAALSGIDSGVAAAELAQSNLQHLIFTRRWHFQPLLAAQPEAAQVAIRTLVQRRHDPGALCQMYAGAENAMDVESFEIVLDHLVTALREELATGNPDASSGRLYGPLTTVGAVVVPELVGRLRSRKHGELPRLLGEYLLAIAPRENLSARLTDRIALQVLQRIGDSALLEWVKRGLRTSNKYSRIDALQESHKHADAEVVALLRTIALGALHGQDRFESYLAIHALTHLEAWDAVVEATVASGLSISPFPLEERRGKPPLSGKFVEDLYSQALTGATTPGLLLAAALTRDPRFLEIVRRTVSQTEIQADTLLAAAIAAEALCIQDDVSVQHLASKLRNADAPERLPHIVLRLGTPLALEAVEEHLRRRFDSALCADLAEQAGWESRATQLAWERRFEAERSIGFGYMLPFFTTLGDKSRLHYLEELALGKRRGLIDESLRYQSVRALSKIDRDRAYDAGFGAVQDPTLRQRARLPALLVELDQNRAVPQLIEMVRTGESEELELDVADAVSGCDIGSMIDAMLCSDDATARRAGCILAARREVSESTSRLLRERASDVDALVASAAMHALSELSRARGVRWLIEEAVKLRGERRWTNIDHAVAAGAGNRDVPPVSPSALTAMRGELSPLEVQASHESLRKGADEYRRGVKDRVRRRAE